MLADPSGPENREQYGESLASTAADGPAALAQTNGADREREDVFAAAGGPAALARTDGAYRERGDAFAAANGPVLVNPWLRRMEHTGRERTSTPAAIPVLTYGTGEQGRSREPNHPISQVSNGVGRQPSVPRHDLM